MTELAFVGNILAAGIGALIAVYVILGVILALGVFALVRLAVLSKKVKKAEGKEAPDCDSCEKLQEKDREIDDLKKQLAEAEKKPAPVVTVLAEERSLSESLAAATVTGKKGLISKKSIIAYLSEKYGDSLELNARANRTPNGKLLLSDNHFAFASTGKRVCFTYVYETDEGTVLSLIRLDEPYVEGLLADHPEVRRSAFPKNKEKDWYSVVADDTFTEESYYAVLDHAIELIRGSESAVKAEEAPVEEKTLSESLAVAKEKGAVGVVTKKSIIAHLGETFGEKVELNGRVNRTPNGKLLMSDNHFAFAPDGKRVCFTYIYEDDDGRITILLRTTAEHAKDLRAAHANAGAKSAFPKNKERDWYSVVVDDSFTEKGVYDELDRAAMNIIGAETAASIPAEEAPVEEKTLSESLAAAKEKGAVGVVTKKSIIAHLGETFGEKVELNGRVNRTPNGKLLMSDNHFAFAPDGKRVCFTYIYEDDDGRITILLRTTAEHAKDLRAAHANAGAKSAFPKNKERDWYSVVVDDSFTEKDVYAELDRAAMNIIGAEVDPLPEAQEEPVSELPAEEAPQEEIAATVAEPSVEEAETPAEESVEAPVEEPEVAPEEPVEEEKEVSLSESLAAAKSKGAIGIVTKKTIFNHLADTFENKVELNGRANRTPNGKLLMSDNHFAFAPDGKRVCFTYIYEDDDGRITILLRTTEEHAADLRAAHPNAGAKSAFPKNKERDWYSVVVDDSFTEKGVYDELDRAVRNITEAAPLAASAEESEELSLKESLAAAKNVGAVGIVTKKSIIDYLTEKYGDGVETNGRANRTPNGKLLMSDNHFALAEGKRVCFTYVYEDEGRIVMLVRASAAFASEIQSAHKGTGSKSAFPKNKEKDWYSVIVDDTFTAKDVFDVLDASVAYVLTK